MPCSCETDGEINMIYACSGAANTGLLADRVMRRLRREKVGSGACLAAMGADLSGFLESARSATRNLVIDGCKVGCGAKIFDRHGIPRRQFVMTDYGVEKGKTEITDELVEAVAERIASQVRA